MKFHIHSLILWPKSEALAPRTVTFDPEKVSVITGDSRTGKSATLSIVDYCLGAGKCAIPVGKVRDHVAWYGVCVEIEGKNYLFARKEPGTAASSTEYCVRRGDEAMSLDRPTKTDTVDAVKGLLDRLAGLPMLEVSVDGSGFHGRPSFRDLAAFNFLPQHIVANPYVLFFKTDTAEHRQKLAAIFPYVLNVIDASYLSALHELEVVRDRLRIERKMLEERQRARDAWTNEVHGMHALARELSLLPARVPGSVAEAIDDLRRLATAEELPPMEVGRTVTAVDELQRLRSRDLEISQRLADAKSSLAKIRAVEEASDSYDARLGAQTSRMDGLGWFQEKVSEASACPLCRSDSRVALAEIGRLSGVAAQLQTELIARTETQTGLERARLLAIKDISNLETELVGVRERRVDLEETARENDNARQSLEAVYRFLGRVSQAIENLSKVGEFSDLQGRVRLLEAQERELSARMNEGARQARQRAVLSKIGGYIGQFARALELERSDDPVELVLKDFSLRFDDTSSGRKDYLWEIGSGANWMGYHIATFLALHRYFAEIGHSPVPMLLMIDQPSQVYFPSGYSEGPSKELSTDELATKRIFEVLTNALRFPMLRNLQIVVVEHAGERIWGSLSGIHKVEQWNEKNALIPSGWIDSDNGIR